MTLNTTNRVLPFVKGTPGSECQPVMSSNSHPEKEFSTAVDRFTSFTYTSHIRIRRKPLLQSRTAIGVRQR